MSIVLCDFVTSLMSLSRTTLITFALVVTFVDPRLTARHGGGHTPIRIVLSQTMNLPEEAHLWDVSEVSTIVVTQRGARRNLQKLLAAKGVEVVEFDILNPREVMEYFHDRGYLSVFWECGGTLAASAITSGVIHKVRYIELVIATLLYFVIYGHRFLISQCA